MSRVAFWRALGASRNHFIVQLPKNDLLELHSIRLDVRYRCVEIGLQRDTATFKLPLQEKKDLLNGLVNMNVGEPQLRVAHQ